MFLLGKSDVDCSFPAGKNALVFFLRWGHSWALILHYSFHLPASNVAEISEFELSPSPVFPKSSLEKNLKDFSLEFLGNLKFYSVPLLDILG